MGQLTALYIQKQLNTKSYGVDQFKPHTRHVNHWIRGRTHELEGSNIRNPQQVSLPLHET